MEIERKFLLFSLPPRSLLGHGESIRQGYIQTGDPEIRVRQKGARFFLTIKSGEGISRQEFEVQISEETFARFWPLTEGAQILKTRYMLKRGEVLWEIDEYEGSLTGLYVAEVELKEESQVVDIPEILNIRAEVSLDPRYRNKNLALRGVPRG